MAMSHGCGEMDEGYCLSTPPVGMLGNPLGCGRLGTHEWTG